jgi:hypothetical protein
MRSPTSNPVDVTQAWVEDNDVVIRVRITDTDKWGRMRMSIPTAERLAEQIVAAVTP